MLVHDLKQPLAVISLRAEFIADECTDPEMIRSGQAIHDACRQMEALTPLGCIGVAEDIAAAVLYLVSPAGRYVTGKVLEVDGGLDQPNLDLGLPDLTAGTP